MTERSRITIAFLLLAIHCLSANVQSFSSKPQGQSPPAQADRPDSGTWTGSTYKNEYFGLTLTIPQGWQVQDSSFKKRINERGKELVTSDDPTTKSELNRAIDNTLNLLIVTQYPLGEARPFNSMFICAAEKIQAGVRADADYISALKNTLKYSQVPITIERDAYSEQLGGVAFAVIDFKSNYSGAIVSQKYYAHVMKSYTLSFIAIYQTDEQLKAHTEILRSVAIR